MARPHTARRPAWNHAVHQPPISQGTVCSTRACGEQATFTVSYRRYTGRARTVTQVRYACCPCALAFAKRYKVQVPA